MTETTRERKVKFINDFGTGFMEKAVIGMLRDKGHDWLTDEQIEQLTAKRISDWRSSQRMMLRNRKIWRPL